MYGGVDVGARLIHCAIIGGDGRCRDLRVLEGGDDSGLRAWAGGLSEVGIDAPQSLSSAPHRDDLTLAPKFRIARCGEIDLGRRFGFWVPWPAPTAGPLSGWMAIGLRVFGVLAGAGLDPIEVYPHAAFARLLGRRPAPKLAAPGRLQRAGLLAAAGIDVADLEGRDHHHLDAMAAALVARDRGLGRALAAGCGHDGSAIWLPALAGGAG